MVRELKEQVKELAEAALAYDDTKPPPYRVKQQLVRYTNSLCYTQAPDLQLNPTFLHPPSLNIRENGMTSIYIAVQRYDIRQYIEELMPTFKQALASGKLSIEVFCGDVFDMVAKNGTKFSKHV